MNNKPVELQDIYLKLGQNIIMFQRLEGLLKFLISRSHVESSHNVRNLNLEQAENKVSKQTMGNLCNQFIDSIFSEKAHSEKSCFEFSFHLDASKDFIEKRQMALTKINNERNSLIHELLESYDLSCVKSRAQLNKKLLALEKLMENEFELMKNLVKIVIESSKYLLENLGETLNEN